MIKVQVEQSKNIKKGGAVNKSKVLLINFSLRLRLLSCDYSIMCFYFDFDCGKVFNCIIKVQQGKTVMR